VSGSEIVRKRSLRNGAAAALIATLAGVAPALAQEPGSRQTREFIQAAAQTDQFEIMEATTALAQSKDEHVRTFAQEMIQTHRRTSDTLQQAVARAGLKPPEPGLGGDQSMFLASLQSQRGPDFDKVYLKQQALAHRAALAVEQGYASSGDDQAIRQAAASTVPIITHHLEMTEQLQAGAPTE
jgi:putative membrane protein